MIKTNLLHQRISYRVFRITTDGRIYEYKIRLSFNNLHYFTSLIERKVNSDEVILYIPKRANYFRFCKQFKNCPLESEYICIVMIKYIFGVEFI